MYVCSYVTRISQDRARQSKRRAVTATDRYIPTHLLYLLDMVLSPRPLGWPIVLCRSLPVIKEER